MKIQEISLDIILDSRGQETLQALMASDNFKAQASVPSGKSKGAHEMFSLGAKEAIGKFQEIKTKILEKNFSSQKDFDGFLISLDNTENKSNLGGNLILSLSLAFARLMAKKEEKELFRYINSIVRLRNFKTEKLPFPIFNVINGGAHAKNNLDFQEFQVIPMVSDFGMAMAVGAEFYRKLGDIIYEKFGKQNVFLGDEAGYSAPFNTNEEAIETIAELIAVKKYPLRIGLDVAATQFFHQSVDEKNNLESGKKEDYYLIGNKRYLAKELKDYYLKLIDAYNIISIEDPFYEEDFLSFRNLTESLTNGNKQSNKNFFQKLLFRKKDNAENISQSDSKLVIADDLTTTNPKRLKKAIKEKSGNAILIKLNQIGTLTETLKVIEMAYENNWQAIVSHRSGETEDDFIADLAVAVNAWGIKSGAPATPYRMAKYNRILEIYNRHFTE